MPTEEFEASAYWKSRLGKEFNLTGVGFRRKSLAFNGWIYKTRTKVLDGLFEKHRWSVRDQKVLDIGSGTGYFIEHWLTRNAARVTGVDVTEVSIETLKEKFPDVNFHLADVSDEDFDLDGSFDWVSIFDVLYHIVDDDKFSRVARNLAPLCKPGARVIVTDLFGSTTVSAVKHCRNRSLKTYESVFAKQGFVLVEKVPLFFALVPPTALVNPVLRWIGILAWEAATALTRWQLFGHLIGGTLYGIDVICRRLFSGSLSGQLVVFEFRETSES